MSSDPPRLPSSAENGVGDGAGSTVLVVDDQQANVRMVSSLLARAGYNVVPALGGAEGLELARLHKPDVMLVHFPGADRNLAVHDR